MEDLSNQVIKGYRLQDRIGAGGFGVVHRAIQEAVGREVAIKIILEEHANRPDFIRRFETEAQLVARLEHPYIVPLYDYWREPNRAYLVMRYLRGGSVRDILEETGAVNYQDVIRYVSQLASALSFAHHNGVIHRDLKSDNIMLDESGNAYLGDFGIAKDLGGNMDLTKDAILGTPAYLPPEQIKGEAVTPQSDIYSFGILIYEMLTGIKPFIDQTPATILFKQLNEPLPQLGSHIPSTINDVLQRATSKNPADRYTDPIMLARDLYRGLQLEETSMEITGLTGNFLVEAPTSEIDLANVSNPYKGLRAFQQADASDFFGRSELVDHLLERLDEKHEAANFLAVVGPSGSGKSSVIKAGLLPAIQLGKLPGSQDWFIIEMVPGTNPLEELEAALLRVAINPPASLLEQLKQDERGLLRAVKRVLPDANSKLVLLIDQFEEVFTLEEQEAQRSHFLQSLVTAVQEPNGPIKVIITLRADFYDQPLLYSEFGKLIRQRTELVLPLSPEELEEAITAPARRIGMLIENSVVSAIINDVNQQPGALPLLQYALTELFERREGRAITMNAYEEIGGTLGALGRRAEELYSSFDDKTQAAARQMFLRLVTLGEGTEDTRRRVVQSELLSLATYGDTMPTVIETFGKYRLLTLDHDPMTRSATVEVAHEALIRQWERLREWLNDSREDLRLHRRLTVSADEWRQSNRERSFLARGVRLQQLEDWRETTDIQVNEAEREFLEASLAEREAQQAAERARQERERQLEERSRLRLRLLVGVMTIAAIIGSVLAVIAFNQRQLAETALAIAERNEEEIGSLALAANARNALIENDPQLALALALEANDAFQPATSEVVRVLSNTIYSYGPRFRFEAHDASVLSVTYNEDGTRAASASIDGEIIVWNPTTGDVIWQQMLDGVFASEVDFSPDDTELAGAISDGSVHIWNAETGDLQQTLAAGRASIESVQYSPNGDVLAAAGGDRVINIWDRTTGDLIRTIEGHTGVIFKVRFSPNGQTILTGAGDETLADNALDEVDRTMRLWDVSTGEQLQLFELNSGFVRAIAFSPDGQMAASGTWDSTFGGTIRIWDIAAGEEVQRLFGHTTPITALEFSPDGSQITSVAWDRNLRVWDLSKGVEAFSFTGFDDRILAIDYAPNGETMLIGIGNPGDNIISMDTESSVDRSVWVWDLKIRDEIAALDKAHQDWVWAVDISPDGTMIASGGGPLRLPTQSIGDDVQGIDSIVRVWDSTTYEVIQEFEGHTNTVDSVAFLPDNQRLLSGSWDGLIILWDIATGERIQLYREHDDRVYDVVVSADGSRFLSASRDNTIRLWDTETGDVLQVFEGHEGEVVGVSFNPDETLIASASGDRTIRLWDVETGEQIRQFNGHTSSANEAVFSPDGQFIVSSSWDDTIRMWNVETGEEIKQFTGHNGNTFGLAFTQDGQTLLSTSQDTSVRMWDVETTDELHRFNQHTDWVQEVVISPDGTFAASAGQDNAVRIWRIARTPEELIDWANASRYIRELTCAERERYRLDPCEAQS